MGAILAILASPPGQALIASFVTAGMNIIGGADPADELTKLQPAAAAYRLAVAEWEQAKRENPS